MTEQRVLRELANGRITFTRDEFFSFDEIDQLLRSFSRQGYVGRVVRMVSPKHGRLERVDVPEGLTFLGERRLAQIQGETEARPSDKGMFANQD